MSANPKSALHREMAAAEARVTGKRHCPYCFHMRPIETGVQQRGRPWCCHGCAVARGRKVA